MQAKFVRGINPKKAVEIGRDIYLPDREPNISDVMHVINYNFPTLNTVLEVHGKVEPEGESYYFLVLMNLHQSYSREQEDELEEEGSWTFDSVMRKLNILGLNILKVEEALGDYSHKITFRLNKKFYDHWINFIYDQRKKEI